MTDRDSILGALPRTSSARPTLSPVSEAEANWDKFRASFTELGGQMLTLEEAKARAGHCIVESDAEPFWGSGASQDVWTAETGVTMAEMAIAETGSIVVCSSNQHRRLGSLAPPRHIVLVHRNQLIATLDQAFQQMPKSNVAIISGPSRTADIEGVLVNGVHGPKEIWVVVLNA